ncbi:MAG TPA: potassium transporter TrkG [Erysipelotrichaceae bacterium]|nr:potassium transporter TrkG [Erysipelotrichaceae bacterium]
MRVNTSSLKSVFYYTGNTMLIFTSLFVLPIIVSLGYNDWNSLLDFTISMSISIILSVSMILYGIKMKQGLEGLSWRHGLVVASLTWILLSLISAIPYVLSGHSLSYLDAIFDVMSGFTTTGVFLLQDLDHISQALNFWRHLLTFVGGQGMIVLAISFFVKEIGSAYKFYVGEGKDIALVPNVKGTAQWIWKISLVYLLIGTILLWLQGMRLGLNPLNSFFHGLYIFEAAWSTGGFAPNYQNILFYHDFLYESIGLVFFIIGSFNFGLHFALIQGKYSEFRKNIEVVSFFVSSFVLSILAVIYLNNTGMYTNAISLFRRVVYNLLSAHTTTGFGTVYAQQFISDWGGLGITVMVVAMLIGGSACSTAGGIKGLRIGIIFKGIYSDIIKLMKGEKTMRVVKYHHIKDQILDDTSFRSAASIAILYVVLFTIGVILTTLSGYGLMESAFEVASVSGNVGLSVGIIQAGMPAYLKVFYIIAMYLGRLEFISIFVLIGMFVKGVRKWFRQY